MEIKMYNDTYEQIRKDNIIEYGTGIERFGPTLLANLYSDRTHFIYELLQNAEDACERAKKTGIIHKYTIRFQLFLDRLEVRHNGIPFDEKDVKGICGIVEGTKNEDFSQIGKFGIGFKSVYAYTKSPEIYSGDKSFCIKNYVQPFPIKPREDIKDVETLFVIPFNHDKITNEVAFEEIKNKFKNLGLRTLLFLRNIEEISWKIESSFGSYSGTSKTVGNIRWVNLLYHDSENTKNTEKWLVLEKKILNNLKNQTVEIAYLINKVHKLDKEQIVPTSNTDLVAFFSTAQKTYLNFLIQGPYETTPARDQIQNSNWNEKLIEETAVLVSESISKIKEMDLLDVDYLNTLPIDPKPLAEENSIFNPIYNKVKEMLSSAETLLPTYKGRYISEKHKLINRYCLKN